MYSIIHAYVLLLFVNMTIQYEYCTIVGLTRAYNINCVLVGNTVQVPCFVLRVTPVCTAGQRAIYVIMYYKLYSALSPSLPLSPPPQTDCWRLASR